MDLPDRREMYRGMGEGFSRAFDLALTPAIFAVLGYLLDRTLGLVPLLTIVFFLWAFCVTTFVAWRRYDADMRRAEDVAARRRLDRPAAERADVADMEPARG